MLEARGRLRLGWTLVLAAVGVGCAGSPSDEGGSQVDGREGGGAAGRAEFGTPRGLRPDGATVRWETDGAAMVRVPGTAISALPQHGSSAGRVAGTAANIWVDVHEVTVSMFRRYCLETGAPVPEQPTGGSDDGPVVNVSWTDAAEYARWSGKRLPTSQEWMAAARGDREFPWGSESPERISLHFPTWPSDDGWRPAIVGGDPRDVGPFGCRDMGGNVQEWVADERRKKRGDTEERGAIEEWRAVCGWRLYTVGISGSPPYVSGSWRPKDERDPTVGFRCVVSE